MADADAAGAVAAASEAPATASGAGGEETPEADRGDDAAEVGAMATHVFVDWLLFVSWIGRSALFFGCHFSLF